MAKKSRLWQVVTGKNGSKYIRAGLTLIMPMWNTQSAEKVDDNETVERIAACVNAFDGVPTEQIQAIVNLWEDKPLRRALAEMIEGQDEWNDISYVEDDYPEWFLELAGGLKKLKVTKKKPDDGW